jgi:hypothetical protein
LVRAAGSCFPLTGGICKSTLAYLIIDQSYTAWISKRNQLQAYYLLLLGNYTPHWITNVCIRIKGKEFLLINIKSDELLKMFKTCRISYLDPKLSFEHL